MTRDRSDGSLAAREDLRHSLEVVECELNTACNRSCAYCPQAVDLLPATDERMASDVLGLLLEDLARIDFRGRFSHHLFGEPLLDEALGDKLRRIRDAVPRPVQILFTNGDLGSFFAPLLEDGIDDPVLREKLAHHTQQCMECREQFEITKKALGR